MTNALKRIGALFFMSALVAGCGASARYPVVGLQRALLPGLDSLSEKEIRQAVDRPLEVEAPATAGLAWLNEATGRSGVVALTEYQRTGVLNATLDALRHQPFSQVTSLPTVTSDFGGGSADAMLALRSAAARFNNEIGVFMQTGTSEDTGFNGFAVGFIGLVTTFLFPGVDVDVASSAELCAVDVRSGVMIACTQGRAQEKKSYLFPTQVSRALDELREKTVRSAAVAAADELVRVVAQRLEKG